MKVRVTEIFTLKDFDKLRNIVRYDKDEYGKLFVNDTFECDKDMYNYLNGDNKYKRSYVELIKESDRQDQVIINDMHTLLVDGEKVFDELKKQENVNKNNKFKKKSRK